MEALATRYRPTSFDSVCSQESIVKILQRQLELKQFKNAYLFCGASGCGKTTIARIFANELNRYKGIPIEVDAASIIKKDTSGAQAVRDMIINTARERSIDSEYKVYIIDECQAFSSQAWQAFLKCIEEPPEYTIFIFCTTDPQKIPATILNRVMRFNFTRISQDKIVARLNDICQNEGFTNYVSATNYISRLAQGCMRDAISMLDKAAAYSTDLDINNVLKVLGNFSYDIMFDLVSSFILKDERNVLGIVNYIYNQGNDLKLFIDQLLTFCLDIDKYAIFNDILMTSIPENMEENIKGVINFDNATGYYANLINTLLTCKNNIKNDTNIRSTIEVNFLCICRNN